MTREREHALAGLLLTTDPERPIVACTCGEIASGVDEQKWNVMVHGDGTVSAIPSLNWPGHFHVYAAGVPILEYEDIDKTAAPTDVERGTP